MTPAASILSRPEPSTVADLFHCRSIAVIGASTNPVRFSGKIVPSLQRQGFSGDIYPINPRAKEIAGLASYPDLRSVPGDVDCVVYALAAENARGSLKDCASKKVKLLVVPSAGFSERGDDEGRRLQEDLVAFSRDVGMRILGPNCFGFANFAERTCVSAAAVLDWKDFPVGRVGVVSQSGGLGLTTIVHDGWSRGIGFSHVVTTGNEADLDTIDIARFLVADLATDVILMTTEAVRDPAAFIALAREAGAANKPIVILKSGRSELGKAMAASHTGALAGSAAVFDSVCAQFGIVMVDDVDDLVIFAEMFSRLRRAGKLGRFREPGQRCAAMSISGGHVGLFADHASLNGLAMPSFAVETEKAVADILGFQGHFLNPLDTTARVIGSDDFWGRCTAALLDDPGIELVAPIITVSRSYDRAARDLVAAAERSEKIVIVIWAGGDFEGEARGVFQQSLVPLFATPSRAATAIRALDRYSRVWGRGGAIPLERASTSRFPEARALLLKASSEGRSALTERESKAVLAAIGVTVTRESAANSVEEAVAAARAIGFPIAMKGEHPDIPHKTEAGLVLLNLSDEAATREGFDTIRERMARAAPPDAASRVLVQEMVPPGSELILGLSNDPEFGVVVLLGSGGVFAEIMNDAVTRLPPFDHAEARRMIAELRGRAMLEGARGREPAQLDQLADLLVRLGNFAVENSDIVSELDVNPLIAIGAQGFRAADGLIVLRTKASSHGD